MEALIPARLSTLGHPQRLAVFRLLMRRYPDRVAAGELAAALGLKPSTLSAYLAALMQAGLVAQERAGTSLRYTIAMEAVRDTFEHLLRDCCRGRPEVCAPVPFPAGTGPGSGSAPRLRVLFVCTGNSARSIMAEAILRTQAGDRFEVHSAGTRPRAVPNPQALAVLRDAGHDVAPLRCKPLTGFRGTGAPHLDIVVTVCNQAANEECPPWPGAPVSAHWGLPAPTQGAGGDAQTALAVRRTHDALHDRIRALAALPLAAMDRLAVQRALDDIGRHGARA